jgi:benzodiazapine receptor
MQRRSRDWGGNLLAFAVLILLNILSSALPINGQTMAQISARYPSLFTPAGFTFSIWGVIYLGLLVFAIWQALPAQRSNEKVARLSTWFQINCLANAVWIVVWHYDLLALSLLVMFVILATLALIYRALIAEINVAPFEEHLVLYLPFSLYTGWITLATLANASALQTGNGWDDVGLSAVQWTLLKLAIAGAIGARVVLKYRDPVFGTVVAWGTYGIAAMQSATPAVAGAALTLAVLTALLVASEFATRISEASWKRN